MRCTLPSYRRAQRHKRYRRPAMKKSSTAATKQNRNLSQKLTIGLDLGDRNSWYCVLDETGRIQREQRVATTARALQEVFISMPRSRIALETGMHSPWVTGCWLRWDTK